MKRRHYVVTIDYADEVDEQVYLEVLSDINNLDPNGDDIEQLSVVEMTNAEAKTFWLDRGGVRDGRDVREAT